MSYVEFLACAESLGVELDCTDWSQPRWGDLLANCAYVPVSYTPHVLNFEHIYFSEIATRMTDMSVVVRLGGQDVGLWPLSVVEDSQGARLCSQGRDLMPPLWVKTLPQRARGRLMSKCFALAHKFAQTLGMDVLKTHVPFLGEQTPNVEDWTRLAALGHSQPNPQLGLYVDLRQDEGTILSHMRKSYKPLIKQGAKLWHTQVNCGTQTSDWAAFQALHRQVAGRATRSQATWDAQYAALCAEAGVLITLRDTTQTLVGAGYFTLSESEGNYSVAAYDRSLFDKPLGHIVQIEAIRALKARGVRWYRLGPVAMGSTQTDKERDISAFKAGFATHTIAEFNFTHEIPHGT